jgi:hypothetical protein
VIVLGPLTVLAGDGRMPEPLAFSHGDRTMNDLMSRMDNLVRFANDLEHRMSESGFGGVFGVAEQVRRIRQALDRVQPQEIHWARNEVQAMIGLLSDVARNLDELHEVKTLFDVGATQFVNQGDGYATG